MEQLTVIRFVCHIMVDDQARCRYQLHFADYRPETWARGHSPSALLLVLYHFDEDRRLNRSILAMRLKIV